MGGRQEDLHVTAFVAAFSAEAPLFTTDFFSTSQASTAQASSNGERQPLAHEPNTVCKRIERRHGDMIKGRKSHE